MPAKLMRREALAAGGGACLCLVGGLLTQGCARVEAVDVEAARPPNAPRNFIAMEDQAKPSFHFVKGKVKGVLVRTDKGIIGYVNRCTHMGGPTTLREGRLVCLWHGSVYDPATGSVLKGPAKRALTPLKLEVKDGMVLLVA